MQLFAVKYCVSNGQMESESTVECYLVIIFYQIFFSELYNIFEKYCNFELYYNCGFLGNIIIQYFFNIII
jgi:hypothetical protein